MKTKINQAGSLLIICIALFITAANTNSTNHTKETNGYTIKMQNSAYTPATLTVTPNSVVTWVNDDNVPHTVTATDGSFNSGDIAVGASYNRTFTTKGTINYYDTYNNNMKGIVIVSDSARLGALSIKSCTPGL